MTPQNAGTTLVLVALFLWLVSWVGLASYGLVWVQRDRGRASISLCASLAILSYGTIILTQTPGAAQ